MIVIVISALLFIIFLIEFSAYTTKKEEQFASKRWYQVREECTLFRLIALTTILSGGMMSLLVSTWLVDLARYIGQLIT